MYKDAAIVVFVISDLHFANLVKHGYKMTKDFAAITKLDKTGYEILEINGQEPISEYARILGVSKDDYLKDPEKYSLSRPFGLMLADGHAYIKEALPNSDKKTMHSTFRLNENSMMNILEFDEVATINTIKDAMQDISKDNKGRKPAMAFFNSCSGRRPLLKDIETKSAKALSKKYSKLPYFGFYSFGEIGSTKSTSPQTHSQTVTSLVIFEDLLSD